MCTSHNVFVCVSHNFKKTRNIKAMTQLIQELTQDIFSCSVFIRQKNYFCSFMCISNGYEQDNALYIKSVTSVRLLQVGSEIFYHWVHYCVILTDVL